MSAADGLTCWLDELEHRSLDLGFDFAVPAVQLNHLSLGAAT